MFMLTLIAAVDPINRDLFASLYYDHSSALYRIIFKKVQNKEDSEDILQDTYRKVYQNIRRFRDLDEESTIKLLVIYAKNTAMDFLRKKGKESYDISLKNDEETAADIADISALPEEIFIKKERTEKLAEYIDSLTENQRHAILLKYKYEMSNKEIAKIMCISQTAVSSLLDRARNSLRKKMGDDDNEKNA